MRRFLKQFNWRFLLVRILVNSIALAVAAAVVPKVYFVNKSIWNLLFMALTLGVLNALVKPVLQAMTLHFIVATYGLVIVLVNAVLLWLLSLLFPERFAVESLVWVLLGGLVLGVLSSFLESLLGLTMPIVSDEPPELRQQLEKQAGLVNSPIAKAVQTTEVSGTGEIGIVPGPPTAAPARTAPEAAATESGPPEETSSGRGRQTPAEQDGASLSGLESASPADAGVESAGKAQQTEEDQA